MPADDFVPAVDDILERQAGVISRRQAVAAGMPVHSIRRQLRRREWVRVHAGVYVDHTGPLTWLQRAWSAVLYAEPAALCLESALDVESPVIHVAISRERSAPVTPDGVRIHRMAHLDDRVLWHVGPPRMRYEEAVLDVAARAVTDADAVAVLARSCQSRRTAATRLLACLSGRRRVRRRNWLRAVLVDIADGTCSVVEHGYLNRVERPHGLPRAVRQQPARSSTGIRYRDAVYGDRLLVELDGRLYHDSPERRDADFERDLDAAAEGRSTVRLSYRQVFDRPCRTAAKVAQVSRRHGIPARARPCGPHCELGATRAA